MKTTTQNNVIRSISACQHEILNSILVLNDLTTFDADLSYGNGRFYKHIPQPKYRFDLDETRQHCEQACSTNVPLKDSSINSCIFDPPFLCHVKKARAHNSIMAKRFGGYWRYDELEEHYTKTIEEAFRIMQPKGIFVFKCQDIIHNHKLHSTHMNIMDWAQGKFRLKDLFILTAKHRMPMPKKQGEAKPKQKHARVFHSFFLVLESLKK